jgi:hypothetical protein
VSEILIASIITVTRSGELGMLAVTSNRSMQGRTNVLQVTANVVPSLPILVTLIMEAILSYETSVLTRATWRHIRKDEILHSHSREHFKSYIALTGWAL